MIIKLWISGASVSVWTCCTLRCHCWDLHYIRIMLNIVSVLWHSNAFIVWTELSKHASVIYTESYRRFESAARCLCCNPSPRTPAAYRRSSCPQQPRSSGTPTVRRQCTGTPIGGTWVGIVVYPSSPQGVKRRDDTAVGWSQTSRRSSFINKWRVGGLQCA